MVNCDICGREADLRKCIVCGKSACPNHYYIMLGVCSDCVREDLPKGYIQSLISSDRCQK